MIRDALDPTHESEKIKEVREDKEINPSYRQLRGMLAAMSTHDNPETEDEQENSLSPQDEDILEKAAAQYHSEDEWSFLARDAPKELKEPPSAKSSVRFNPRPLIDKSPKSHKRVLGHSRLPLPPPLYGGKGSPMGPLRRRVLFSPEDGFDPHLEAYFPVLFDEWGGRQPNLGAPPNEVNELKQACATYGATAPYTFTLLDALLAKWMTPYDRRTVAKACLSGGQYLLWRTEYEDLARKQANANRRHGPKHITQDMLPGTND